MNISDLTPLLDILASLGSEESTHDVLLRFELAKKVKPEASEQGVENPSKEREIKEKDEEQETQTKPSESTSSQYSNTEDSTTNQSTINQSTTNQPSSTTNQPSSIQQSDEIQSSQNTNVSGTYTSIISLQQTKDELEKVRNELLQRRSTAQQAVEEVRAKIRAAENLQHKKTLDKKMDELLEENARMFQQERQDGEREEIMKKVAKGKSSDINREITNEDVLKPQTDGVSSNNTSLLSKLNVLPSTSWPERLELVKKFYPYVDIEHIKSFNSYLDGSLVRNVAFIVRAPLLFKIPITLGILNRNDSVVLLEFTPQNSTNSTNSTNTNSTTTQTNPNTHPLLVTLNTLSPLFASALTRNYIPNKKCNLVVYGLSLLAIEVQRRISFIYKLLRKYAEYAESRFERIVQEEEIKDNVVLFATLKLVSSVTFVIKQRRVTLTWDVVVKEIATAECGARVNLHVEGHDIETLFTGLCEMYGEMEAFDTIVEQMGEKME